MVIARIINNRPERCILPHEQNRYKRSHLENRPDPSECFQNSDFLHEVYEGVDGLDHGKEGKNGHEYDEQNQDRK